MTTTNPVKVLLPLIKASSALGISLQDEKDAVSLTRAINVALRLLAREKKYSTIVFPSSGTQCWAELAVLMLLKKRYKIRRAVFSDIEFKDVDSEELWMNHISQLVEYPDLQDLPEYMILQSNLEAKNRDLGDDVLYVSIHYQSVGEQLKASSFKNFVSISATGEKGEFNVSVRE